ncbi:hypothetical protein ATCC90586_010680 [Pythium insidiosum]|nr:hypothetical protein ATCC90586_010680 [Pythium insidiosum]
MVECVKYNPKCDFGPQQQFIANAESGLMLRGLGGQNSEEIPFTHVYSFFVDERFPLGFTRPPTPVTLPDAKEKESPRALTWHRVAALLAVFATHVLLAAFLVALVELHLYIQSSRIRFYAQLNRALFRFFGPMIRLGTATAVGHGIGAVFTLYQILTLCRQPKTSPVDPPTIESSASWLRSVPTRFDAFTNAHAVEIAQTRALLEVALQTYQAQKLSQLIATLWINRLIALIIVANCWLTPTLRFVFRERSATRHARLVRLTLDTALDITYALGIPIAVLYPYARDFDPVTELYPNEFYVRDDWSAQAVYTTQQFFVSSWLDLASKMLPLVFLIYRLYGIRRVLMTPTSASAALNHRHNRCLGRMLNAVLVAWGAAVLALHSHASLVVWTQRDPGCLLDMQPWAQASYTCAVLELSCSQRGISGRAQEIDAALGRVNSRTLQSLVVSNCPALEVPASMPGDAFPSLIMLKLFNTTVARWHADAALNAARFPTLQQLLVLESNMTEIPSGLTAETAPTSLRDVKIVGTNLTMLPMELATVWRGVSFLTLERNPQLMAVPPVVGKLKRLVYLSLHHNAVQSSGFPSTILAEAALFQLLSDA